MLVSIAAAAALFAGCGGGSEPSTSAETGALQQPSAAPTQPAAASTQSFAPVIAGAPATAPLVADTGPIPPAEMDDEALADIATTTLRQPRGTADEARKPDAGTPATDKALEQAAAADAEAAQSTTTDAAANAANGASTTTAHGDGALPVRVAAMASLATRGGGRSVPTPSAPAPAPSTQSTDGAAGGDGGSSMVQAQEAVAARPINTSDIRLQVEASRLFSSYKWAWGMECAGKKAGAVNIPEYGILGFDLGNGLGSARFGKVADPDNSARKVLMFRPNSGDPLVSGAPRCEMTFSPSFGGKLPVNQDVWFAFGLRLKDWVNTTDEQILMQWHWSNGSIPLGPFLALSLKGGKLQIDSKANAAYPPAVASTTSRVHWTNGAPPTSGWTYFVVKARISPHTSHNPYLKVWRDGVQIVNYAGPLGYNYPQLTPYLKIGHYQWVAAYNNWISAASTKTVLVRTPALINDTAGLYTEFDIRSHVKNR